MSLCRLDFINEIRVKISPESLSSPSSAAALAEELLQLISCVTLEVCGLHVVFVPCEICFIEIWNAVSCSQRGTIYEPVWVYWRPGLTLMIEWQSDRVREWECWARLQEVKAWVQGLPGSLGFCLAKYGLPNIYMWQLRGGGAQVAPQVEEVRAAFGLCQREGAKNNISGGR